jgi:hypothetical protein
MRREGEGRREKKGREKGEGRREKREERREKGEWTEKGNGKRGRGRGKELRDGIFIPSSTQPASRQIFETPWLLPSVRKGGNYCWCDIQQCWGSLEKVRKEGKEVEGRNIVGEVFGEVFISYGGGREIEWGGEEGEELLVEAF